MPCGFSAVGLDPRRLERSGLVEGAITGFVCDIFCSDDNNVTLLIFASRKRPIAWTKAAQVGAR